MSSEQIDLEAKVYLPTQQLFQHLQIDLAEAYLSIRQQAIEVHNLVAAGGRQWYQQPVDTTALWCRQLTQYGREVYATARDEWFPVVESTYQNWEIKIVDFSHLVREDLKSAVENPQLIATQAISAVRESVMEFKQVSWVMVQDIQSKTVEMTIQLIDHPAQALQRASMDMLNDAVNVYHHGISLLLTML